MNTAVSIPSAFREPDVARVVNAQIERGERDPALIACNTADVLFRTRRCAIFPPPPEAPVATRAAWDQLVGYVDDVFRRRGIQPGDPQRPGTGVDWSLISTSPGSLDLERYPWEAGVLHDGGRPAPGTFWAAQSGDGDGALVRAYLYCALAMAGADVTLAHDDSKVGRRLRRDARETILSCDFNDQRVTSASAELAGGRDPGSRGANDQGVTYVLGSRGRGLVWAHRHYDDLSRMAAGLAAKRGVDLGGNAVGSGRSSMLLYMPAVNLIALRSAQPVFTTEGLRWPDGGSTSCPPPAVARLGIDTSGVEGIG